MDAAAMVCTHWSDNSCHPQVFTINPLRAWGAVATTVISVALSVYLISISPPYLLPLAWSFAGTAWTGVSPLSSAKACSQLPDASVPQS